MVNNVCINIYQCQHCNGSNIVGHAQCVKYGGYLADRIFKNISTSFYYYWAYMLKYESIFSTSFWGMILRERDLHDFNLPRNIHHTLSLKYKQFTLAINHSTLCATHARKLCQENKTLALRVQNAYYNFNNDTCDGTWSVINQPRFQIAYKPTYTLCENSVNSAVIITNCSALYMTCDDGTCVHDSLVCDGKSHCLGGEDEANCKHICSDNTATCMSHCHHRDLCFCSPEYFQCLSGGCVPLQKLCDKTVHCTDASDEPPTCVYLRPEQLCSPSLSLDINHYINNMIKRNAVIQQKCFQDDVHSVNYADYKMYAHQASCVRSSHPSDIKFLCSSIHTGSTHRFSLDRLCVYDHDCDDTYSYHCANGFHLLKCEHAYCVGRLSVHLPIA